MISPATKKSDAAWKHERHASLRFIEFGSFCPLDSSKYSTGNLQTSWQDSQQSQSYFWLNTEGWIARTCRTMRGHCTERLKAKSTTAHTLGLSPLAHCILYNAYVQSRKPSHRVRELSAILLAKTMWLQSSHAMKHRPCMLQMNPSSNLPDLQLIADISKPKPVLRLQELHTISCKKV